MLVAVYPDNGSMGLTIIESVFYLLGGGKDPGPGRTTAIKGNGFSYVSVVSLIFEPGV
jgi:hypothetical protein